MSNDTNICVQTGRLTRDPELAYTSSGKAYTRASIANNESWKVDGEWHNEVTYLDLILWNGSGEAFAKVCRKGDLVSVVSKLKINNYTDKNGENRRNAQLKVTEWNKLSSTSNGGETRKAEELDSVTSPQNTPSVEDEDDGGIPF